MPYVYVCACACVAWIHGKRDIEDDQVWHRNDSMEDRTNEWRNKWMNEWLTEVIHS